MKRRIFLSLLTALLCLTAMAQSIKPIVGITTGFSNSTYTVRYTYIESVKQAGGIPLLLPFVTNAAEAAEFVERIDALILSGGADVNPFEYGEQPERALGSVDPDRDRAELLFIEAAKNANKPILGICRGLQIVNVAFGGSLYQDVGSGVRGSIKHGQSQPGKFPSHSISIARSSHLYSILGVDSTTVNSFHHQAVKQVASGFRIAATAPDGVVEAIEGFPTYDVNGVQFHPEYFVADNKDPMWVKLFKDLVDRAVKKMKR